MSSMGKAMMGTGEAEGEGRALKASEMAITNPLIDDYTLKGAKGLLVNITGGKDLKLFEVDEAVNKVRAEVDSEAELIIGAITDSSLDGKMRVSIVATSLDGQQPESKSVINMVHRIQNRNPGYSDFSKITSSNSFDFSTSNSNIATEGATALKIEDEMSVETPMVDTFQENHQEINEQSIVNHDSQIEESLEQSQENKIEIDEPSNGLENFAIEKETEEQTPELFNSDEDKDSSELLLSEDSEVKQGEEDDLEIPAFLRRQKN